MHSEPITRSPSSLSFTRSTPCVDGCCGPIFRTSSSAPSSVCCFSPASVMVSLATLLPAFNPQVFLHPRCILLDDVVVLAQWITLPLVRQQDARQIGVPGKNNPEHVEHLALQPVGRGPNVCNAGYFFPIARASLHAQTLVLRKRIEIEHHIKSLFALRPIHCCQIGEQVEL